MTVYTGHLRKMKTELIDGTVNYTLNLDGEGVLPMNELVGQRVIVRATGKIACVNCGKSIKKTYQQGHCYPCMIKLPECDTCQVKPETCHFAAGTCRDEDWAKEHCFIDHTLYLARSSSIKIGITRSYQQIHRWMDQGAIEAMVIGRFPDRHSVGLAEVEISKGMSDKTNWRHMLQNKVTDAPFDEYIEKAKAALNDSQRASLLDDVEHYTFNYPVTAYPEKVSSKSLEKMPIIDQTLMGIKGQYLIFENCVTNLRNQAGYGVEVEV